MRIVLACGLLLLAAAAPVRAQDALETGAALSAPTAGDLPPAPRAYGPGEGIEPASVERVLAVDLVRPLLGLFSVELEERVFPRLGLFVAPGLFLPRRDGVRGAGVELGARIYLGEKPPVGLWLGPRVGVGAVRALRLGEAGRDAAFSVGAQVGLSWVLRSVVLRVGAGITWADLAVRVAGSQLGFRGVGPDAHLGLGRAF